MARLGSFDFPEMRRMADRMNRLTEGNTIDQFIRDFLLEMAYRAERKIKRRTPVDIGDLRRNWQVGSVIQNGDTYEIEIFNNTEYAAYVEFGHRQTPGRYVPAIGKKLVKPWVEGRFMMTISMKEMERELPKYLERRQKELLNKMLSGR